VAATELALKHVGRPVPNAALLAGFAAVSGRISLDSVNAAIRERFPARVAEANVAAATEAYDAVLGELREAVHAEAG
jgi:pyruvate ferredoxin oxidoreductase gamma subunit